jgi:hypothetical protein
VLRLRPIMMTMLVATTGHKLVRHTTTCMRGASGIFGSGWSLRSGRRTGAAPHWRAAL